MLSKMAPREILIEILHEIAVGANNPSFTRVQRKAVKVLCGFAEY